MFGNLESEVLRSNGLDPAKFEQWMQDAKSTYSVDKMYLATIDGITYLKWQWAPEEYLSFWLDFNMGCIHIALERTSTQTIHFRLAPILAGVNMCYEASLI